MNLTRRTFSASLASVVALPKRFNDPVQVSLRKLEAALIADGCETARAGTQADYPYPRPRLTDDADFVWAESMRRRPDGSKWHDLVLKTGLVQPLDEGRIAVFVRGNAIVWQRALDKFYRIDVLRRALTEQRIGAFDITDRTGEWPSVDGETWTKTPDCMSPLPRRVVRVRVWYPNGRFMWTATDADKPLTDEQISKILEGFRARHRDTDFFQVSGWWTH